MYVKISTYVWEKREHMPNFEYSFPSITGMQAGKYYFVSMCPLKLIPKIFLFDEDELKPELRAQRSLNRSRIPEISRYIPTIIGVRKC